VPTLTASPALRALAAARLGSPAPPLPAQAEAEVQPRPKPQSQPAGPSHKQRKAAEHLAAMQDAREHLLPILAAAFPIAFCVPSPPLAIGVSDRILEAMPDINKRELSLFLNYWTSRSGYRRSIARGEMRVNLDGSPAGEPAPDQVAHAKKALGWA
jgi:hypothetical protein